MILVLVDRGAKHKKHVFLSEKLKNRQIKQHILNSFKKSGLILVLAGQELTTKARMEEEVFTTRSIQMLTNAFE